MKSSKTGLLQFSAGTMQLQALFGCGVVIIFLFFLIIKHIFSQENKILSRKILLEIQELNIPSLSHLLGWVGPTQPKSNPIFGQVWASLNLS